MKKLITSVMAALTMALAVVPVTQVRAESNNALSANVRNFTLPNVLPEMQQADFWVAKTFDPDRVLMTSVQIQAFNGKIQAALPNTVFDLTTFPTSLSREELHKKITPVPLPEDTLYVEGKAINKAYFQKATKRMSLESMKKNNPVAYAFTIKRSSLGAYPTTDRITDEQEDKIYDWNLQTTIGPAEPILVLYQNQAKDWAFVQYYNYAGWMPTANLAIASNRDEWLEYIKADRFLVVTGGKLSLGPNPLWPERSDYELVMGTKLPLVDAEKATAIVDYQSAAGNYQVSIPVRDKAGKLSFRIALIPFSADVSEGYPPYTRANILRQVFKLQGERYGWGGLFHSWDCSSLVMDVFRSFGFNLPRNTDEQEKVPGKTLQLTQVQKTKRNNLLATLNPGTLLYLPGHTMIYLGTFQGRPYVISAVGSVGDPTRPNPDGVTLPKIPIYGIVVSDLTLSRKKVDLDWLTALTSANEITDTEGVNRKLK
ncbi:SH3 domain-containing protein [Heliobacterium chlorum]|uniref:SH3 domain-containing protein n=1 Tax=Heliobacterium chlorum TaxID=2698 RepID=A0ABR7T6F0_HELCL|nr:NlpC/P60 family protein [Heliobacterium chlorum]MBC9785588.1 SH3 domain-containing protein [Heliobacterium chlorum]